MTDDGGFAMTGFPHAEEIGMRLMKTPKGEAKIVIPYDEKLVGDPETGVVHGGVITTLLDTGCGVAAISKTGLMGGIATLDLRIDYMRPAKPGQALTAVCECYRVTRSVAFARGAAYDGDPDENSGDPVATASGAFMITKPKKKEGAK